MRNEEWEIPNSNPAKRGTKTQINPNPQTSNIRNNLRSNPFGISYLNIGAYLEFGIWSLVLFILLAPPIELC
jgi:hypothetical protein